MPALNVLWRDGREVVLFLLFLLNGLLLRDEMLCVTAFFIQLFCKNPVFEQYVNDRRVVTMLSNALNSGSFASSFVVKIQSLCSI